MRYIDVEDDFVKKILTASSPKAGTLSESQEVFEEGYDEEQEAHACPLCESQLEEPISEEAMQECVDFIMQTINEAIELEGELFEESEEEEEEEEEEELEEE